MREPFPPQGKDWMPVFALLMEPVIPALLVGGKGLGHGGGGWWEGVFTHTDTRTVGSTVHTHTPPCSHTYTQWEAVYTHTHTHTHPAPEP